MTKEEIEQYENEIKRLAKIKDSWAPHLLEEYPGEWKTVDGFFMKGDVALWYEGPAGGEITIPSCVKYLGYLRDSFCGQFGSCNQLGVFMSNEENNPAIVHVPETVEVIGVYDFEYCNGIKKIYLHESIKTDPKLRISSSASSPSTLEEVYYYGSLFSFYDRFVSETRDIEVSGTNVKIILIDHENTIEFDLKHNSVSNDSALCAMILKQLIKVCKHQ